MNILYKEFIISDEKEKLQLSVIVNLLNSSYWAQGRSYNTIEKSIQNSLCFGIYHKDTQIGFARCITDYSTIFYLADVIINENYKGQGLGKILLKTILEHEKLKNCNSFLRTKDAHTFYKKFGYSVLNEEIMYRPV